MAIQPVLLVSYANDMQLVSAIVDIHGEAGNTNTGEDEGNKPETEWYYMNMTRTAQHESWSVGV